MSTPVKSVTFREPVPNSFSGRKTTDKHFDAEGHKLALQVDLINRLVRLERDGKVEVVVPFENLASFEPEAQGNPIVQDAPEGIADALLALGHPLDAPPKLSVVPPAKEPVVYPDCGHPPGARACEFCGKEPVAPEGQPLEGLEKAADEHLAATGYRAPSAVDVAPSASPAPADPERKLTKAERKALRKAQKS